VRNASSRSGLGTACIDFEELTEPRASASDNEKALRIAGIFPWPRGMPFNGREYWSFTYLIDAAGRIIAQFHQSLPIAESGTYGPQEIRFRLPGGGAPASALRLRIGVYDPSSGHRLSIAPLPPNASSRLTRADQDTALIASY
jgi:hypothetical protein